MLNAPHEKIACPLCGSDNSVLFHKIERPLHPNNIYCNSCSFIFVSPRVSEEAYITYYIHEYAKEVYKTGGVEETKQIVEWRTKSSQKKIAYFPGVFERGMRVFEVGAGTGSFLNQLKLQFGCEVEGVEPSEELRRMAQTEFGITLHAGTLEEYAHTRASQVLFDRVVLDQVVEHLYNPLQALQTCKTLLKPSGMVYIGVPNAAHPAHPINEFFIPEHIMTFTPWTIMLLLWRAGFKVVHMVTPDASPLHLVATPIENNSQSALSFFSLGGPYNKEKILQFFKDYKKPA